MVATGRILETTCWVLGTALITLYCGTRAYGELERRQAIAAFAHTPNQSHSPDQSAWSSGRIRAYAVAAGPDDSERPVAVLRIASVSLEVPVYANSSERNLNRGAGLIAGTARPRSGGNVAIAAHRDGYFRALRSVAVGDVVELESRSQMQSYRITELVIVEPTEIWPLDDTQESAVTLVTCYPFYFVGHAPQRFIVRAVAVD
jgi:sortase A